MTRATARAVLAAALGGCASVPNPEDEALERYYRANELFERKLYREAIPHYEFALSIRDRLKDAYYRLSRCYEEVGDDSRAIAWLENARRCGASRACTPAGGMRTRP